MMVVVNLRRLCNAHFWGGREYDGRASRNYKNCPSCAVKCAYVAKGHPLTV